MVPGQEVNGYNLGISFHLLYSNGMFSVLIRIALIR